jgi:hypothetical protein
MYENLFNREVLVIDFIHIDSFQTLAATINGILLLALGLEVAAIVIPITPQ